MSDSKTITTTAMDIYKEAVSKLPTALQGYALEFAELFAPMALSDVLDRLYAIIEGDPAILSETYNSLYGTLSDDALAAKAAEGEAALKELNAANAGRISTWNDFLKSCAKSLITALVGLAA